MSTPKSKGFLGIITFVLSTTVVTLSGIHSQLQAQPQQPWKVSLSFPPTEDVGVPAATVGGGDRGPEEESLCTSGDKKLTALMPTRKNVGKTMLPNPTFFVYVPTTTAKQAEFLVVDERGNSVYEAEFAPPSSGGIVKLSLPKTVSLETDKNYIWQFAIICNPDDPNLDEYVQGSILRTQMSSDMEMKLEQAKPIDRARLFAGERVWNETLTTIAGVRSTYPSEWKEFLSSVGLEEMASEPIIDCCQVDREIPSQF